MFLDLLLMLSEEVRDSFINFRPFLKHGNPIRKGITFEKATFFRGLGCSFQVNLGQGVLIFNKEEVVSFEEGPGVACSVSLF
jgi:hypothetical protein